MVAVHVTVVVLVVVELLLLLLMVVLMTVMDLWLGKWLYIVVNHRDARQS